MLLLSFRFGVNRNNARKVNRCICLRGGRESEGEADILININRCNENKTRRKTTQQTEQDGKYWLVENRHRQTTNVFFIHCCYCIGQKNFIIERNNSVEMMARNQIDSILIVGGREHAAYSADICVLFIDGYQAQAQWHDDKHNRKESIPLSHATHTACPINRTTLITIPLHDVYLYILPIHFVAFKPKQFVSLANFLINWNDLVEVIQLACEYWSGNQ